MRGRPSRLLMQAPSVRFLSALNDETRLIHLEEVSNPTLRLVNIARVSKLVASLPGPGPRPLISVDRSDSQKTCLQGNSAERNAENTGEGRGDRVRDRERGAMRSMEGKESSYTALRMAGKGGRKESAITPISREVAPDSPFLPSVGRVHTRRGPPLRKSPGHQSVEFSLLVHARPFPIKEADPSKVHGGVGRDEDPTVGRGDDHDLTASLDIS